MGCIVLALVHCMALEETHGLKLAPRLTRELWPPCEQASPSTLTFTLDALHGACQQASLCTLPASPTLVSQSCGMCSAAHTFGKAAQVAHTWAQLLR